MALKLLTSFCQKANTYQLSDGSIVFGVDSVDCTMLRLNILISGTAIFIQAPIKQKALKKVEYWKKIIRYLKSEYRK